MYSTVLLTYHSRFVENFILSRQFYIIDCVIVIRLGLIIYPILVWIFTFQILTSIKKKLLFPYLFLYFLLKIDAKRLLVFKSIVSVIFFLIHSPVLLHKNILSMTAFHCETSVYAFLSILSYCSVNRVIKSIFYVISRPGNVFNLKVLAFY